MKATGHSSTAFQPRQRAERPANDAQRDGHRHSTAAAWSAGTTAAHAPRLGCIAFWSLMSRWGVLDRQALALIGHSVKSYQKKQPEFAMTVEQLGRLIVLLKIERLVVSLGKDPSIWLMNFTRDTIFRGLSPLSYMICEGRTGMDDVVRQLHLMGATDTRCSQA